MSIRSEAGDGLVVSLNFAGNDLQYLIGVMDNKDKDFIKHEFIRSHYVLPNYS